MAPLELYQQMALDLSLLGLSSGLRLEHIGDGRYTANTIATPLRSGQHALPITLETVEGEPDPLFIFSIPLDVYPARDLIMYEDGPGERWTVEVMVPRTESDLNATAFVRRGSSSHAILVRGPLKYVYDDPEGLSLFGYTHLEFWINGGEGSGQDPTIAGENLSHWGVVPEADTWILVSIPVSELPDLTDPLSSFLIGGQVEETFYIDDMRLVPMEPPPPPPDPTAVEGAEGAVLPFVFGLSQNVPNPFNSRTAIRFALPLSGHAELAIYNLTGQRVTTLVEGVREAGTYTIRWDSRDDNGQELATGVYLYRLQAGAQVETRKLLLLR